MKKKNNQDQQEPKNQPSGNQNASVNDTAPTTDPIEKSRNNNTTTSAVVGGTQSKAERMKGFIKGATDAVGNLATSITSRRSTTQSPSESRSSPTNSLLKKIKGSIKGDPSSKKTLEKWISDKKEEDDTYQEDKNDKELMEYIFRSKEVDITGANQGNNRGEHKVGVDMLKDNFEIVNKDKNGRMILHRISMEHRAEQLASVLQNLPQQQLAEAINNRDRYGNTALMLACVNYNDTVKYHRKQVLQELLINKADPNLQNPSTLWTPLHWAARYGDLSGINLLLQYNAQPYIPDNKGYFPIDYAGLFNHGDTVEVLIKHAISSMSKFNQKRNALQQDIEANRLHIGPNSGSSGGKNPVLLDVTDMEYIYPHPILEHNPLYHTSLLYWAAMYQQVTEDQVVHLLDNFESYPQGSVKIHNGRTPIHAAAQNNDSSKLVLLINKARQGQGSERNPLRLHWDRYLRSQKRLKKLRLFNENVFQPKLRQYGQNFNFDLTDNFMNTPAHLASQKGCQACVKQLIDDNFCRLDSRNLDGWMPKDFTQHNHIRKYYKQFYQKLDSDLSLTQQESVSAPYDNKSNSNEIEPWNLRANQFKVTYKGQQIMKRELLNCREWMPRVPSLVLQVSIDNYVIINNMVTWLSEAGFQVQMFASLNDNVYYIALDMDQDKLEQEAKQINYKMKLIGINDKKVFDPVSKVKYEPFRSKDVQFVMFTVLNGLFNTHTLKMQKIILNIIPMHDMQGIFEMEARFIDSSYMPMPFNILKQMYKEGKSLLFTELNTVKNYYGEKVAFHYVWMSFYTTWLLIPAGLGVALTIYQIITGFTTLLSIIYAVIVCLWATIFIERWKRKVSELSLLWGIFDFQNQNARSIRPQFLGDECFSHTTHQVDKCSRSYIGRLIQILSLPILASLIALNTYIFFLTIDFKKKYVTGNSKRNDIIFSVLAGVLNGVAIQVINGLYQFMAGQFINLENLKYTDTHESSFTYKLFIFKFINTNLSLFYSAFAPSAISSSKGVGTAGDTAAANYNQLYYMLVGMTIQKSLTILFSKYVLKIIKMWVKKAFYFRQIRQRAREQSTNHQNFIAKMDTMSESSFQKSMAEVRDKIIFRDIYDKDGGNGVYRRLIFNTQTNVESQQILVDAVEINNLMEEKSEQIEINEISELFILFGYATLYSAVCPVVAFLVMIHNMFDMRLQIFVSRYCIRRPLTQTRSNIGPWMDIAEFISLISVITNCLFLYVAMKENIQSFFEQTFNIYTQSTIIWILVGVEHFIIATKVACIVLIKDHPSWVGKTFLKKECEVQQLLCEEAERDETERIKMLQEERMTYQQKNLEMLKLIRSKLEESKTQLESERQRIAQLEQSEELARKQAREAEKKLKEEKAKSAVSSCKLANFLEIHQEEWMGIKRMQELEVALGRNLQVRLFKQTFNLLERQILGRRISKLYNTKQSNQINCVECSAQLANTECIQCEDHYCSKCSESVHNSSHLFSLHTRIAITAEPIKQFSLFSTNTAANPSVNAQQKQAASPLWKKFEYFNFPVQEGSHLGQYIQKHFAYLKRNYIEANYIEGVDKIDYIGLFVDQKYELLTDTQAKKARTRHAKLLGGDSVDDVPMSQQDQFNDEELFYMNRIAFYLFCSKGDHLTYANFINRLDILQNGAFHKKLAFWLSIILEQGPSDDGSQQIVQREQMANIFRVIFLQDVNDVVKDTDIIEMIFQDKQEIRVAQFVDGVNKNEKVNALMRCVLQCHEEKL